MKPTTPVPPVLPASEPEPWRKELDDLLAAEREAALESEPQLLGCLDALGRLLRSGLWMVVACALLAGPVVAHGPAPPARVWIDGHDIDGPPPGPVHVPVFLGASVWPTNVASKLRQRRAAQPVQVSNVEGITGINGTVFGRYGFWRAELDVFQLDQTLEDAALADGVAFPAGSALTQSDIVARLSRELHRLDLPWGHYQIDGGLRFTMADRTLAANNAEFATNRLFMSAEIQIRGRHVFSEHHALHTRSTFSTDNGGQNSERSAEFQAYINRHIFETPYALHDLQIGVRVLSQRIAVSDDTRQETVFTNTYMGPEIAYACRW